MSDAISGAPLPKHLPAFASLVWGALCDYRNSEAGSRFCCLNMPSFNNRLTVPNEERAADAIEFDAAGRRRGRGYYGYVLD